jgi:hypothetical protein
LRDLTLAPLIGLGVLAVFFAVGYSAHPREHVKSIEDGKLISPKYQYLFGRDAIASAMRRGKRRPFVGE